MAFRGRNGLATQGHAQELAGIRHEKPETAYLHYDQLEHSLVPKLHKAIAIVQAALLYNKIVVNSDAAWTQACLAIPYLGMACLSQLALQAGED